MRDWIQVCDWIVQNRFELPSIMDGHIQLKDRTSTKYVSFLRQLAIHVARTGRLKKQMRCAELFNLAIEQGIDVPCMRPGSELDEDLGTRAVGMALAGAFRDGNEVRVDEFVISREELEPDEVSHHRSRIYRFAKEEAFGTDTRGARPI